MPLFLRIRALIARKLFNMAWALDVDTVSEIIEFECDYVYCDNVGDYLCNNGGV
jgi:hypothetical protein